MDAIGGEAKTLRRSIAYPVLFTDSAGILQIARPGQAQRSAFKVTIREHVGQAERVVIFLCQSGQWDGIDGSITVRDARMEQKDEKKINGTAGRLLDGGNLPENNSRYFSTP